MFVWFIRVRPCCRRVHSVSLGSFARAPCVVEFNLGAPWDSFGRAPCVFGFIRARPVFMVFVWSSRVRLVHSRSPRQSSGSFVFISFIRASPWGCRAHSRSFGCAPAFVVFILVRLVLSLRVHSRSVGSLVCAPGVVVIIRPVRIARARSRGR